MKPFDRWLNVLGGNDISFSWGGKKLINHIFVTFLKGWAVYALKDMALLSLCAPEFKTAGL